MTKKFGQQLLQHLDIIKPILLLDTSVVRIANQKFKDHATKSEIDEFELSYKDVGAFFPTCSDQLFPIVEMLSFPRKGQKPHVFLLDLLTVLIILIRGDLNEKARYLFDWYNFTATGLLTELEHSIFISRCSSCLHRIKLMGLIEITRDDSRYSALAARVKLDGPNLKFMPGLDFNEFCVWLRTSKESQVIFSFFKTFERLVDTFMALKKRTNAVHDIMEQKRLHGRYDIHVPRLDLLNPTEHDSGVNIVYSSSTHVSLCIDFEMDKYLEKEVYVKCECLRPTRVPFYDMPKTTYSRVFGNRDLPSLCCHKHYGLVSYQRFAIPLQWELGRCRMLKVDIQNLTPESKYVLEVYSKAHKYREISVQTLPLPEQIPHQRRTTSISILPGTLSASTAATFIATTQQLYESDCIVFTGPVCSIEQALREGLVYVQPQSRLHGEVPSPGYVVNVLTAAVETHLYHTWKNCVEKLFQMRSASTSAIDKSYLGSEVNKHMLCFAGFGPWSDPDILTQLKKAVVSDRLLVQLYSRVECIYAEYLQSVTPPSFLWELQPFKVVFLLNSSQTHVGGSGSGGGSIGASTGGTTNGLLFDTRGGTTPAGLRQYVEGLIDNSTEASFGADEHLVIVMRTPLDCLAPSHTWVGLAEESKDMSDVSAAEKEGAGELIERLAEGDASTKEIFSVENMSAIPAPLSMPLRGKHEIIHGEYSSISESQLRPAKVESISNELSNEPANGESSSNEPAIHPTKPSRAENTPETNEKNENNDEIDPHIDCDFKKLVATLMVWLQSGADPDKRKVTLISTGWVNGRNFEIWNKQGHCQAQPGQKRTSLGFIRHENLLPTKRSTTVNDRHDPDTATDDENAPSASAAHHTAFGWVIDTDTIISRMQKSLPNRMKLDLLPGSHLRTAVFEHDAADPAHKEQSTPIDPIFLPLNLILDRTLDPNIAESLPAVQVTLGPRLMRVTDNEAVVAVHAKGYGLLTVTLYELPLHADYRDAVSFVDAELSDMRVVAKVRKRCFKQRECSVRFDRLLPFTSYCVSVEPWVEVPQVVHFRTLYSHTHPISSSIVAGVSDVDYTLPSATMHRVASILDGLRPRASPVYLLHQAGRRRPHQVGLAKPSKLDINSIYKRSNVVHTLGHGEFESRSDVYRAASPAWLGHPCPCPDYSRGHDSIDSLVHVVSNGKFLRIAPRDGSGRSLQALALCLNTLEDRYSEVENIMLFVHRPLIRYLQRRTPSTGKPHWHCDGPVVRHANLCGEILFLLLQWKKLISTRDCQIICIADVPKLTVVNIGLVLSASPSGANVSFDGNTQIMDFSIGGSVAADGVGDLGDMGSIGSMSLLESSAGSVTPPSILGPTIRHLILPCSIGGPVSRSVSMIFPPSRCFVGNSLQYEVEHDPTPEEFEIHWNAPRQDLHAHSIPLAREAETTTYIVDAFLDPSRQSATVLTAMSAPSLIGTSKASAGFEFESVLAGNVLYPLIIRPILHDLDLVEVILGPVVGLVTQVMARIMFELNRDIRQLECRLRPVGYANEDVVIVQTKIKAYKNIFFVFDGLVDGRKYDILLPGLHGDSVLGSFRTIPAASAFAQIAITGNSPFENLPILDDIVTQLVEHQSPDLHHHSVICQLQYGADIAHAEERRRYDDKSVRRTRRKDRRSNTWMWLSEHLRNPLMSTSAVFHLGGPTLLLHTFERLIEALLEHGRRLQLPIRDAEAVSAWYFVQFEEVIKDTFRLAWSIPSIRDALSVGSHVLCYHSQALLPASRQTSEGQSESDKELMQVIRKIFDNNFLSYLPPLYGWEQENQHHTILWRMGTMAVVVVDIVTDRKKLKKKKNETSESGKDSAAPSSKNPKSHPYSLGFFDKNQWKLLKNIAEDRSINHLIICTQKPVIPLTEIPLAFEDPENIPKGETIEWSPTVEDVHFFLTFLLEWLQPAEAIVASTTSKNVALLSAAPIAYTTVVQDLSTGLKIQQMCVGTLSPTPQVAAPTDALHERDLVLTGKIGRLRYAHVFDSLDDVKVNSSRDGMGAGMSDGSDEVFAARKSGFAVMKMWFDSWRATGVWSYITETQSSEKPPGDALLVVGPILGTPYMVMSRDGSQHMMLPILLEVDRRTTITIAARSAFTGAVLTWSFRLKHNRPTICKIGPLDIESRYNAHISKGVRNANMSVFLINTFISWSEANVAVINSEPAPTAVPCANHVKDLVRRCKVPFSGITTVLHVNLQPDIRLIEEFKVLPTFVRGLELCRNERKLSSHFRPHLRDIFERVKDQYRNLLARPSYRELLKTAFNLMMQTKGFPQLQEKEGDNRDAVSMLNIMLESAGHMYLHQLTYHSHPSNHEERDLGDDEEEDGDIVDDDSQTLAQRSVETASAPIVSTVAAVAMGLALDTGETGATGETDFQIMDDASTSQAVLSQFTGNSLLDKIFEKWFNRTTDHKNYAAWKTWVAPNTRVSVELVDDVNEDTLPEVYERLDDSEIEFGNRIIVFTGGVDGGDLDRIVANEEFLGLKFQKRVLRWGEDRTDRQINLVFPSRRYGTRQHTITFVPRGTNTALLTVDSIFRSVDYERERLTIDRVFEAKRQQGQAASAGAKSKKAVAKKAEEEQRLIAFIKMEVNDILSSANPDGYLLIECRTSLFESPRGHTDVVTRAAYKLIASVGDSEDVDLPSPYDYIQLPEWLAKFIPGGQGVFIQDEVFLTMRQDPDISEVLDIVEGDELGIRIMDMYDQSRLSELSRPPDLREIDMDQPGIMQLFLKDLVERVWDELVPENVKAHMISLYDDFVRSFTLSRAMPDPEVLTSAELFAKAMQRALAMATGLMMSMKMKDLQRWNFIMQLPDEPTRVTNLATMWDRMVEQALTKAKKDDPRNFDEEAIKAAMEAKKSNNVDFESDIDELDREEIEQQLREDMQEEEQERRARLDAEEESEKALLESLVDPEIEESEADANTSEEVAQMRAEAKRVKLEFKRMELLCYRASFDQLMELIFEDIVTAIAHESSGFDDEEESETDEKRIAAAMLQMDRLGVARVEYRRAVGPRLTYLSTEFLL